MTDLIPEGPEGYALVPFDDDEWGSDYIPRWELVDAVDWYLEQSKWELARPQGGKAGPLCPFWPPGSGKTRSMKELCKNRPQRTLFVSLNEGNPFPLDQDPRALLAQLILFRLGMPQNDCGKATAATFSIELVTFARRVVGTPDGVPLLIVVDEAQLSNKLAAIHRECGVLQCANWGDVRFACSALHSGQLKDAGDGSLHSFHDVRIGRLTTDFQQLVRAFKLPNDEKLAPFILGCGGHPETLAAMQKYIATHGRFDLGGFLDSEAFKQIRAIRCQSVDWATFRAAMVAGQATSTAAMEDSGSLLPDGYFHGYLARALVSECAHARARAHRNDLTPAPHTWEDELIRCLQTDMLCFEGSEKLAEEVAYSLIRWKRWESGTQATIITVPTFAIANSDSRTKKRNIARVLGFAGSFALTTNEDVILVSDNVIEGGVEAYWFATVGGTRTMRLVQVKFGRSFSQASAEAVAVELRKKEEGALGSLLAHVDSVKGAQGHVSLAKTGDGRYKCCTTDDGSVGASIEVPGNVRTQGITTAVRVFWAGPPSKAGEGTGDLGDECVNLTKALCPYFPNLGSAKTEKSTYIAAKEREWVLPGQPSAKRPRLAIV